MELTYNKLVNIGATFSKMEQNRIYKIGNGIINGKINRDNYYDEVRKMTKNVKSDQAIKSWQRIADYMWNRLYK